MIDSHTLFILEGTTDLPLLRAFLPALFGASEDGRIEVDLPPGSSSFSIRSHDRTKYRINGKALGLCDVGGKDNVRRAAMYFVQWALQDLFPELRNVALVRDLNASDAAALNQGLKQRLRDLADRGDARFKSLTDGPWLCQVEHISVGQIFLGDPSTAGNAAIEDHILELLQHQADLDPSELTPVVSSHLEIDLSPKQQVLLAMVRDGSLTAPAGFYGKVLGRATDDQLKSLADQVGFTELMKRVIDEQPEG